MASGPGKDRLPGDNAVWLADNMDVLPKLPAGAFQLIYIDPPFNTGKVQARKTLATVSAGPGDRTGFGGRRYKTRLLSESSYRDTFDDYLTFLEPRLREASRLLTATGTFYFHIDFREAHYCKLLLDEIFGRECFLNEIIWAYDYGARSKRRWPAKHDTILVYVKNADTYYYNAEAVDREPYMAPGLVTAEKAAKGKLPTTRVVAHHCPDERTREDRLPDTEAGRHHPAYGPGLHKARGLVSRLLRRQRHPGCCRGGIGPAIRFDRQQPCSCRRDSLSSWRH